MFDFRIKVNLRVFLPFGEQCHILKWISFSYFPNVFVPFPNWNVQFLFYRLEVHFSPHVSLKSDRGELLQEGDPVRFICTAVANPNQVMSAGRNIFIAGQAKNETLTFILWFLSSLDELCLVHWRQACRNPPRWLGCWTVVGKRWKTSTQPGHSMWGHQPHREVRKVYCVEHRM